MTLAPWLPLPAHILLLPLPMTLLVFFLLAYAPGIWLLRPFQAAFGGTVREAVRLVLGWAFYTFFADLTLKTLGPTVWGFYLAPGLLTWACASVVAVATKEPPSEDRPALGVSAKQAWFGTLLGVVAVVQIIPIEAFGGVYWGTPEIDWRSRLPVTNTIARDGLPAANPFFNPDGDSKLFFYYGFFLLPAACVHPTIASGAGWDAVGVMAACVFLVGAIVGLFAIALGNTATGDQRGGWVSGLLCYVTGLDLLPVMALTLRGTPPSSIEWWNPAQITAVTAFPVWVPHHTLATLEVILAHVFVWRVQKIRPTAGGAWVCRRKRALQTTLVAVLLAAAAMTSTYVAMLGFLSIFLHGLLRARRLRDWQEGALPIATTVLGGLLALPFYYQLSKLDEYHGPTIQPILRPCPSEEPIRDAVASSLRLSPPTALFVTRLGGLLPQYFFEFGFLFFVLVYWKRTGIGPSDADGLWNRLGVMVVVALVVGSIFVSVRTWNCDLNWRIMHPVQLALLGAAASFWRDFKSRPRPAIDQIGLGLFLIIGALGTAVDVFSSRFSVFCRPEEGRKGRVALQAAGEINSNLSPAARIATDPRTFARRGNPFFAMLLRRQVVISDDSFNAFPYGPHPEDVKTVAAEMTEVFCRETTSERRLAILRRYNVSYVLIDADSDLYSEDVHKVFGPDAGRPTWFLSHPLESEGWRIIQLSPDEIVQ